MRTNQRSDRAGKIRTVLVEHQSRAPGRQCDQSNQSDLYDFIHPLSLVMPLLDFFIIFIEEAFCYEPPVIEVVWIKRNHVTLFW